MKIVVMYVIYALELDDGKMYVGMTNNFGRRIREHKRGKNFYTKNKKIVKVIKIEACIDSMSARKREKYWKSGQGREKLKKIIAG